MPTPDSEDSLQRKIDQGEKITLTEYWEAILQLIESAEKQEAKFPAAVLQNDSGYKIAIDTLRKMATEGKKLEKTGLLSLRSVGNAIQRARDTFDNPDQIPEITGPASRQFAAGYLRLLKHFEAQKVESTGMLQQGLERTMLGQSKSGYQDASDSAVALDKAIHEFDTQNQNKTQAANETPVDSDSDETKLEKNETALRHKYAQAYQTWAHFEKAYLKYQALAVTMHWKAFSKLKELPSLSKPAKHNIYRVHEELTQFLSEPTVKTMPHETKPLSKAELRHKIHKKIPREKSASVFYRSIEPLLSKENIKKWEQRYKKLGWANYLGSFSDSKAQEKIDFEALVDVLTEEVDATSKKAHEYSRTVAGIHTRSEIKVIGDIHKKQHLLKKLEAKLKKMDSPELRQAVIQFNEKNTNNPQLLFNLINLIDSLNKLCPTKKRPLPKNQHKIQQAVEKGSYQDAVCLIREVTYKAACEEVTQALTKTEPTTVKNPELQKRISALQKIISFAHYATRPHHNELERKSLEKKILELYGKPSVGKKLIGALMIAAGYIAKNPKLYEKGWITFQSGYDAGKQYLGAALGWLSKDRMEKSSQEKVKVIKEHSKLQRPV